MTALESRVRTVNLSIKAVCERAGQKKETVYGWFRGRDPQMGNFGRTMRELEFFLDAEEARIFAALAPRFLPGLLAGRLAPDEIDELLAALPAPSRADAEPAGAPRAEERVA